MPTIWRNRTIKRSPQIPITYPPRTRTAPCYRTSLLRTEVAKELQQAITRYASDTSSPRDGVGSAQP
ncbi:hypothetical protein NB063_00375 [Rhodopirellula sp. ICT_H3.1]|uniref:Uncharacterized protein n=1 Tax=Aporhodopirellula aestuarii TaxID=2950107 RepID=A0ABT0TXG1_9BACT|nr:hypothetical protein [Aporhodopirellula aestuarii]